MLCPEVLCISGQEREMMEKRIYISGKRIYVSGTITGTTDYQERFKNAKRYLAYNGWAVINPAELDKVMPHDATHEDYMEICLKLLDLCNAIYMLNGWEESEGAKAELEYALEKGMDVYYQNPPEWKSRLLDVFLKR